MKNKESVRMPYVSGQFYEADPAQLEASIDSMIAEAREQHEFKASDSKPRAVILPHAGYVFSGLTAVKTLARTRGYKYKKVVVIAPSHSYPFKGIALTSSDWYSTPLGKIKVDSEAVGKLMAIDDNLIKTSNDAHNYEHALEVELPILQKFHPDLEMLPIICGMISASEAKYLALKLNQFWNEDILWVISSDFTHYGKSFYYTPFVENVKERLAELDLAAVEKIKDIDLKSFEVYLDDTKVTICGANPIKLLLATIIDSHNNLKGELVEYTTSGHKTGDFSHCVSYVGMCFSQGINFGGKKL